MGEGDKKDMKIPDSIKIHSMDERPRFTFRYVSKQGGIGIARHKGEFNPSDAVSAMGWIYDDVSFEGQDTQSESPSSEDLSEMFEPLKIRPLSEKPTCNFRYVFKDGFITNEKASCKFISGSYRSEEVIGWVPSYLTPKTPQPKNTEWWMCRDSAGFDIVLLRMNGQWQRSTLDCRYCKDDCATPLYKMERL